MIRGHKGLGGMSERITQKFTYDEQLRPIETTQSFAGGIVQGLDEMMLSQMNYNFKDQVTEKNIGKNVDRNGRFLQSIDYLYNGRGWLTSINGFGMVATNRTIPMVKKDMDAYEEMIDIYSSESSPGNENDANGDLFSQVLNYEAPISGLHATAQYNGNISSTIWQVAGREKQAYGFKYDDLNRLTEAYYADVHATENNRAWNRPNVTFSTDNVYKEKMQYDVRGNITSLQRNGLKINGFTGGNYVSGDFGQIDDLQYAYNDKNQVVRIQDNAVTIDPNAPHAEKDFKGFVYKYDAATLDKHYKYDANGNLTYDAHKDIETIEYNYMNLPAKITFTNNRTITFLYDATGKKLRKTVTGNGMTEQRDYLDGIEYKDGKPDQFLHSEGSVRMDKDGQFKYYFVLRDHLGNTRVTFSDLNNDDEIHEKEEIVQINHFYAFGLNMEGNWNGANGANKYQYNGKEWNDDFGLGWNDYGARFYDPAMARWQTVDPLAEKYHRWSPYNYTANNPIRYIDPDGMQLAGAGQRSISAARNNGKPVETEQTEEQRHKAAMHADRLDWEARMGFNFSNQAAQNLDGQNEEQQNSDAKYAFMLSYPASEHNKSEINKALEKYKSLEKDGENSDPIVIELSMGASLQDNKPFSFTATTNWVSMDSWMNRFAGTDVNKMYDGFRKEYWMKKKNGWYSSPLGSENGVQKMMAAKRYIESQLKAAKISPHKVIWQLNMNGVGVIRFPIRA